MLLRCCFCYGIFHHSYRNVYKHICLPKRRSNNLKTRTREFALFEACVISPLLLSICSVCIYIYMNVSRIVEPNDVCCLTVMSGRLFCWPNQADKFNCRTFGFWIIYCVASVSQSGMVKSKFDLEEIICSV